MFQELPVNGFKWVQKSRLSRYNEVFIKNCNKNSDKGHFLKVDVDCPKKLFKLHKDLLFLPEKKVNKIEKLICKTKKICYEYKSLKTNLKSWISIKKLHRAIQFNQKDWLKPYIDMTTN